MMMMINRQQQQAQATILEADHEPAANLSESSQQHQQHSLIMNPGERLSAMWKSASGAAAKAAAGAARKSRASFAPRSSSSSGGAGSSSLFTNWSLSTSLHEPSSAEDSERRWNASSFFSLRPSGNSSSSCSGNSDSSELDMMRNSRADLERDLRQALEAQQACCSNMDMLMEHRTQLVDAYLVSGNDQGAQQHLRSIQKYKAQKAHAQVVSKQLKQLAFDVAMKGDFAAESYQARLDAILHAASTRSRELANSFRLEQKPDAAATVVARDNCLTFLSDEDDDDDDDDEFALDDEDEFALDTAAASGVRYHAEDSDWAYPAE